MARIVEYTIPTRFVLTLGHIVVTLLALLHKDANVRIGLPSTATTAQIDTATRSLTAALVLSLIFLILSMLFLLFGVTIFNQKINTLQIVANFLGGTGVAWFVLAPWQYRAIWVFWAFCSFIPTAIEIGHVAISVCVRRTTYR